MDREHVLEALRANGYDASLYELRDEASLLALAKAGADLTSRRRRTSIRRGRSGSRRPRFKSMARSRRRPSWAIAAGLAGRGYAA